MNILYIRIKKLADSRNISLAQVERDLDFSNGAISTWKTGRASSDKLTKLSKYFGVSTDYLLGVSDTVSGKIDLSSNEAIYTYQGREIPKEDLDVIRRLLESPKKWKEKLFERRNSKQAFRNRP